MVQGHVLCNKWHLCGMCWEDQEHKKSHVSTSPDVSVELAMNWFSLVALSYQPSFNTTRRNYAVYELTILSQL